MVRLLMALTLTSLVLYGCGSDASSTADAAPSKPSRSSSPEAAEATFFGAEDSAVINKDAAAVQDASANARTSTSISRCNKVGAYPAWRACWHRLLDPVAKGHAGLAETFTTMAKRDFPPECIAQLRRSRQTFAGFGKQIDRLLSGIDSDDRSRQVKAMKAYVSTLDGISKAYLKPFQSLTQVCYSPQDLASINSSPTPSP